MGMQGRAHKAWIVVEVDSKDEARSIVPPAFRAQAKIVQLNTFTMEDIEGILLMSSNYTRPDDRGLWSWRHLRYAGESPSPSAPRSLPTRRPPYMTSSSFAQHGFAGDSLQRPLRSRFQPRLKPDDWPQVALRHKEEHR
jgi:hypothetical protein